MKKAKNFIKQLHLAFWSYIMLLLSTSIGYGQSLEDLNHLEGNKTATYYSKGSKQRAEIMAIRCDNVISFYKSLLNFEPKVTLLVLSPDDWGKYTKMPVYGMPHYNNNKTLIIASEDNSFWKSFIPPLNQLPKEFAKKIFKTYADQDNSLTMQAFFDLLAIHELGHAFHNQAGLFMQRKWMGELFANIFLHTYIAEKEPELLPALTIFPQMVLATTNKSELKYTTLNELETNYNQLGQQYPKNYGWYQCRWHKAAAEIYDAAGSKAFKKLWQLLKNQREPLDDKSFVELLEKKVHQSVADVQLNWDK